MKALAILRVSLTVADLAAAQAFYEAALGFSACSAVQTADTVLATLLGAGSVRLLTLQRGRQLLELAVFEPPGAAYPSDRNSNDHWFQHLALATDNVAIAMQSLAGTECSAVSRHGAQTLPGGTVAYKFRDPEGHPLELIALPDQDTRTAGGIDHTAISVADAGASIAFYTSNFGFDVTARQVNTGPAQDALDGLDDTLVDVVGLAPARPAPHLELLGYRNPRGRAASHLAAVRHCGKPPGAPGR